MGFICPKYSLRLSHVFIQQRNLSQCRFVASCMKQKSRRTAAAQYSCAQAVVHNLRI